ncbi:MAG: hypothetical protein M5U34_43485 [Chloroflexi bacterium]|nr:hypothetical protein [Chloroflexota bacterium]
MSDNLSQQAAVIATIANGRSDIWANLRRRPKASSTALTNPRPVTSPCSPPAARCWLPPILSKPNQPDPKI